MSANLLTAAEARKLSGLTPREHVELVLKNVEQLAKDGKRIYRVHDDFWVNGGYSKTTDYQEAVAILEELGYKVSFFYEERQFVNMYTVIEW
jgi:hypothetical protein